VAVFLDRCRNSIGDSAGNMENAFLMDAAEGAKTQWTAYNDAGRILNKK
jgi:hypothetical protein